MALVKKHFLRIILSLLFILGLPPILYKIQSLYYCLNESNCRVWGNGLEFVNYSLGSIFIGYLGAFLSKQKLSKLLSLIFPVIFILYFGGLFIAFQSFIKITPKYVQFRDLVNKISLTTIPLESIQALEVNSYHTETGNERSIYIIGNNQRYALGFNEAPLENLSKMIGKRIKYTCDDCH